MSVLPQDTFPFLGKLEIIEVYEYYDKPVLFACRSAAQMTYLVVLLDEAEQSRWLYVALSTERFHKIRSGDIDLYNAFRGAEDEVVYEVTTFNIKHPSQIRVLPTSALNDEQLPERGEYLHTTSANDEKEALG
jgi:uncharacterized protein DUF6575